VLLLLATTKKPAIVICRKGNANAVGNKCNTLLNIKHVQNLAATLGVSNACRISGFSPGIFQIFDFCSFGVII